MSEIYLFLHRGLDGFQQSIILAELLWIFMMILFLVYPGKDK